MTNLVYFIYYHLITKVQSRSKLIINRVAAEMYAIQKFLGQEKCVGVIECSSYQKLVYNWVVHVFFGKTQVIRNLIPRPPKIKKLLKVQKVCFL